ncbi:MAG: glycosyltransferase [Bryobacteraceae bacterium]|jgi:glycosyltransferase involved in cell wall biosynthesis
MIPVSCIMPTYDRRRFIPAAIEYFLRQDYSDAELVIVDDGADPIADLVPDNGRIRYLRLPERTSVGAKRNLACEQARGEIIVHWDDDDWHAPHRIRYQVEALQQARLDVCGLRTLLFFDLNTGRAWKYGYPPQLRFWISGSTLCYTRAFWAAHRFENINVSEDARFVWRGRPERMLVLPKFDFHIGMIHSGNVSPKTTQGSYWSALDTDEIRRIIGRDWERYSAGGPPQCAVAHRDSHDQRSIAMIAIARNSDLSLPEFGAFNHAQQLPWMRRWELPFVLFQARLGNTMSVLDCTINPANFQERLGRLYPHVLYRHASPIQRGLFVPPMGVPDGGFDRVICVNTLEHLLKAQREMLVAAMVRKLKPNGRIVLTSDYYFDSSWDNPAFLQSGLMRRDRTEIFNGFNKIGFADYLELMSRHGLQSLGEPIADPAEGDKTLYRNPDPHPHASIAGVFGRPDNESTPGKKVLLALLSWNTRDICLDSLHAYIREAKMLRRLGHEAEICICDNGSKDGTPEALRQLNDQVDVPHHFILNPENRGNSIGRNQIIEHMLAAGADYVLFLDGDIEVVPFSSFGMLRYMENNGVQLGCIGADSSGQTPVRGNASAFWYAVDSGRVETTNLVAWTQYGLFRREVFEDGIRFDHSAPFDRAGWGFEDNDLAFQMDLKGYLTQRFFGMVYLHRAARSSIRIMRDQGIDPAPLYAQRKEYVIRKWSTVPRINNGPLADVRRVQMPS